MAYGNKAEQNGASTSVTDALLCTIMCMIDHIVDVHVKDGSIYSGTFYTANVDNGYAIVLKNARRIKNGDRKTKTNVADEKLIDTLVIMSENLVQLVARDVLFPAEGASGRVGEDCVGAGVGIVRWSERDERLGNAAKLGELNLDKRKKVNHTRQSDPVKSAAYGSLRKTSVEQRDGTNFVKRENAETVSSNERQVADSLVVERGVLQAAIAEQAERRTRELEGSRSSLDACRSHSRPGVTIISGTNKVERPSSVFVDASSPNAPQASTKAVLPKKGNHGEATKESKLNPRAQLFSPSLPQHKSIAPSMTPAPSMNQNHSLQPAPMVPVAPAPSMNQNHSLQPAPMVPVAPAKLAPQNNLYYVNGRGDIPYAQHVVGPMGSRTPPVRYSGQYSHLQTGTPYAFPSAQTVMAGRRPLIYVHPVSNGGTQGAAVFSHLPSRPMAPPDLPKLQATMQAMQFYGAPPSLANGQQTYAMPAFIPALPPVFQVPGLNISYGTKFA